MHEIARRILAGDPRAVARACRLIDERSPDAEELLRALFQKTGQARVIGVTGAPGSGKSTLTDGLVALARARGERVGVLAIDPSSPFTGGALLGDRIRMQRHAADGEVFIRSFGTRGAHGGLARSTTACVQVLDAWGARTIFIETVGVGQIEVDVLDVAETVVVVVVPGMGDDVQANKAGILEIADVFALNKADHAGVDRAERELAAALALGRAPVTVAAGHHHHGAAPAATPEDAPRIVRTVATSEEGLAALLGAIDEHGAWLRTTEPGAERRTARRRASAARQLSELLIARVLDELAPRLAELAVRVGDADLDPHTASEQLFAELREKPGS
jgi:LAO/AO transport system kinase